MRRVGVEAFARDERFYLDDSFLEEKLLIRNEMERQGVSIKNLAERYCVSTRFMNGVFAGTKASKDIYQKLEKDFDVVLINRVKPLK